MTTASIESRLESHVTANLTEQKRDMNESRVFMAPDPEIVAEVPGLLYWPRYMSPVGQERLVASLLASDRWVGVTSGENSRRVIHHGYKYDYARTTGPAKTDEIPEHMKMLPMIARFPVDGDSQTIAFEQLIINEYRPGQGISPHVDDTRIFGEVVFCISVSSGTTVKFTHPDGRVVLKYVAPGSAYAMTGESRYTWRHSIEAKKSDIVGGIHIPRGTRYSLTYRTMKV